MTPSLAGRIHTRLALVLVVGGLWTAVLAPLLPAPDGATAADLYRAGYTALLLVATLGVCWEGIYHLAQQLRWEKDWPTLFGLIVGAPEGLLVWFLLASGIPWSVGDVPPGTFALLFGTTWVLIWMVVNGPLRIVLVRWRFRGGRLW